MRSLATMLVLIASLPLVAQEDAPLPAPPDPEAIESSEPSELAQVAADSQGITRLVVENINLTKGQMGIAQVEGVSLKDYAIKENVKIALYPEKGIRVVPSVNPISKGVDIMLFPEKPGNYFLVFAMAREGRLIYLAAPLNVTE